MDRLSARLKRWERRNRFPRPPGFAAVLFLVVCVVYLPVIGGRETFILRDFGLFGYPLAHHVKQCLLAGEIPLWNPLNDCGHPFLAQWNTMVLYPPSWLNLLLPTSWSVSLLAVLHLYVGGLGMYALALKWSRSTCGAAFAGITYAFSGIMQSSLMWPNNIAALGLLPWVMLTVFNGWRKGGRALLVAGLIGGLQMLSGAPEIILFTWVLAGLVLLADLWQRGFMLPPCLRFVSVVQLTTGLAAMQLFPFLDLFVHSPRAVGEVLMDWAISRSSWANFFIPLFENTGPQASGVFFQRSQHWTHSYYCGLLPWLLLLVAAFRNRSRRVWLFVLLVPFAILLAMGNDGGIYPVLNRVLPLGVMRFPVKFLLLCLVALPLVGAFAIRRLPRQRRDGMHVWSFVAGVGLFVVALWLSGEREVTEAERELAAGSAKGRMLLLAAAGVLLLKGAGRRTGLGRFRFPALLLLVWIDVAFHQANLAPSISRRFLDEPNPALPALAGTGMGEGRAVPTDAAQNYFLFGKSKPLGDRIREERRGLYSNVNLIDGVAKVNGFYSLWLPRFGDVQHLVYDGPHAVRAGFADFLGVRHVTSPQSPLEWLTRESARPLVAAGQAQQVMSFADIQKTLPTPAFDPANVVLLESEVKGHGPDSSAVVSDLQWRAQRVSFRVRAAVPTFTTIAQAHYHCWQATVNGRRVPIQIANGAFQAIAVPAGESEVVLEYVDRSFQIGAIVSAVSFLLMGLLWWGPAVRRGR